MIIVHNVGFNLFKSRELEDPQQELLLLRCCTGSSKMIYWLRTCRPDFISDEVDILDSLINDALQHIIGIPLSVEKRDFAHLPLSLAGLGITKASLVKEAAFVASVGASWPLQPVTTPRQGYNEAVMFLRSYGILVPSIINSTVSSPLKQNKEFSQVLLSKSINANIRETIKSNSNIKTKVLLEGRSCKGANYWLTSIPNLWSNTVIDPAAFRCLLKYSIGIPIMSEDQRCPDCGKNQDKFGHHALSCKVASGKIDRHNSIVEGISAQLKIAAINHRVEKSNPMSNSRERPGDLYMPEFDTYGEAYFDVSVISICADAYYNRADLGQLKGSDIRYKAKMKKYPDLGSRFKPLVLESTGGWHAYSFEYLKKLADHIASRTNMLCQRCIKQNSYDFID